MYLALLIPYDKKPFGAFFNFNGEQERSERKIIPKALSGCNFYQASPSRG